MNEENSSENHFELFIPTKFIETNGNERIEQLIDESYKKLSIHYNSIKQTKLDVDFILSVNDYLDRFKAKIYKDFLRRETLINNGEKHLRHFVRLIRCIWKISFEQANEINRDEFVIKRTILYTMTAIDHLLQINFPLSKKQIIFDEFSSSNCFSLFFHFRSKNSKEKSMSNYILNELISMWFHENLRLFQEELCILAEHEMHRAFFPLCQRICREFESICALNWERLQMIQNVRLNHQSKKFETNKDFLQHFGQIAKNKTDLPVTPLFAHRTENESNRLNEIRRNFRDDIIKILLNIRQTSIISNDVEPSKSNFVSENSSEIVVRNENEENLVIPQTSIVNSEINELAEYLVQLAEKSTEGKTLVEQLKFQMKEKQIDVKSIIDRLDETFERKSSKNVDPLFLSALTRLIRQDLEKSSHRPIDKIDHSFVLVEVTHDPSKCSNDRRCFCCEQAENDSSSLSLFYENKPTDSTTFSISVEQNEEFH